MAIIGKRWVNGNAEIWAGFGKGILERERRGNAARRIGLAGG